MIAVPPGPTLALLAALVAGLLGAGAGWRYAAAQGEARLAECNAAREADARAAAEKTAALFARAQEAEAEAAARLAAEQAAADRRLKETRREIYRLASGRECLSGALRLRLNAALAADDVPAAAGGALDAAAGSAGDPGDGRASTDAIVAGWIVEAARLYDACRARIDALRHWDEVTHGGR